MSEKTTEMRKKSFSEEQLSTLPGLFVLENKGIVKISGEDAESFLQGQLTCHMAFVTENSSHFGAICTPKGRMISIFRIFKKELDYLLIMEQSVIPSFTQHISKYIPFYKAEIEDVTSLYNIYGVSHQISEMFPEQDVEIDEVRPYQNNNVIGYGPNRWLVIEPINENITKKMFSSRPIFAGSSAWNSLDILQKIPHLTELSVEKFLPHEVGLPQIGGVSFNKGCYTGQEIIARMEFRGSLNKHPVVLTTDKPTQLSASEPVKIQEDSKIVSIGNVINITQMEEQPPLILACIKDSYVEKGNFILNSENPTILKVIN